MQHDLVQAQVGLTHGIGAIRGTEERPGVAEELGRDLAAGALMVKIAERRATLLGLNPPIGHAVSGIQHDCHEQPSVQPDRVSPQIPS